MSYLAIIPYLLIALGILLGFLRIRPAMLAWGVCAIGVMTGLGIAVTLFVFADPSFSVSALISLLPVVIAGVMVAKDLSYPRINDVTTDLNNPPEFVKALEASPNLGRDIEFPECSKAIIAAAYPDLKPLFLEELPNAVLELLKNMVAAQPGWVTTRYDSKERVIEGEATTPFFGFVDDFVIRVTDHNGGTRIDMRSRSREGLVDAGKNAKRIRGFFDQIKRPQASH